MITIDCEKIQPIMHKLLTFVADRLEVLPILKSKKFILTPLYDDQILDKSDVLVVIDEFLKSIKEYDNMQVIPYGYEIKIVPLNGKEMSEESPKKNPFFECIHCGFMTQYETEWKMHKLIHYI